MSDLRYIAVDYQQAYAIDDGASALSDNAGEWSQIRRLQSLRYAYDAAEGQRVEEIRWCDAHDDKMSGDTCTTHDQAMAYSCDPGPCRIVDATLILPPRAERRCADGYCRSQPACPEGTCREAKP